MTMKAQYNITPDCMRHFMGFVADDITRTQLERATRDAGFTGDVFVGNWQAALDALAHAAMPEFLVLDLSDADDPIAAANQAADLCAPETRVLALGSINDVEVYRQLIALGANDYLVKPVTAPQLVASLGQLVMSADSGDDASVTVSAAPTGAITGVVSARGGAGASTVAVNLAWALATEAPGKTALVDLDLRFGTTAVMLDLEPGHGFREALDNPGRMDSLFLERAMVRASDNLMLLAGEEDIGETLDTPDEALGILFAMLRQSFDHVIVDIPRWQLLRHLKHLDRLFLVSEPTLVGIRDGLRIKDAVTEAGLDAGRLSIVLNRGGAAEKGELKATDMVRGGLPKPDYTLPAETKSQSQAQAIGQPLFQVAPRCKAARVFRKMAHDLAIGDDVEQAGGTSLFAKLIGGA